MLILRFLFFCVFLSCSAFLFPSGNIHLRHYKGRLPIPFKTIHSIQNDSDNFIWIASNTGVFRFDGKEFISLDLLKRSGEPLPAGCRLFQDTNHQLWILNHHYSKIYHQKEHTISDFSPELNGSVHYPEHLVEDSLKQVWGASEKGVFVHSLQNGQTRFVNSKPVLAITLPYSGAGVWSLESTGLFCRYDETGKLCRQIATDRSFDAETEVVALCEIEESVFLLTTRKQGVFRINLALKSAELILSSGITHTAFRKSDAEYWIGAESGIYIYNGNTKQFSQIQKDRNNPYGLTDNAVYALCKDKEGGVWIGTYFHQLSYLPDAYFKFRTFAAGKTHHDMSGSIIREFCKDKYGNLWIGTEDAGLNRFNPKTERFTHFSNSGNSPELGTSNVHGLVSIDNELWVGSFDNGIEVLRLPEGKSIRRYRAEDSSKGLISDFVLSFLHTSSNRLLVGTNRGVQEYIREKDHFVSLYPDRIVGGIYQMTEDQQGAVWFATTEGLYKADRSGRLESYAHNAAQENTLSSSYIQQVKEDHSGTIWIATNKGLNRFVPQENYFERITLSSDPQVNCIFRIEEDHERNLWLSTDKGIVCYSPQTGEKMHFGEMDDLPEECFNYNSSFRDSDGTIYMGSLDGFITFKPETYGIDRISPNLFLNKVRYTDGIRDSIIYPVQMPQERLRLAHTCNTLQFDYTAPLYTTYNGTQYAYRLIGKEKEWQILNKYKEIEYQNLPPGIYSLELRSTNGGGIWMANTIVFDFEILPPWWKTLPARMLYVLLIVGILFIIWRFVRYKEYKKRMLREKELTVLREKELYDAKIHFFTTMAHELRTPLTLMRLPIEQLLERKLADSEIRHNIGLIDKNTNRLTKLCNQLLDFRKMEKEELRLNYIKSDIRLLAEQVIGQFLSQFEQKGIRITYEWPDASLQAAVDQEAFRKILYNLLGNVLKYGNRDFRMRLENVGEYFRLSFFNDGALIPEEDGESVFSLFYRRRENKIQEGSGIGLSFSRQLAEMHHGTLALCYDTPGYNHFCLQLPIHQEIEFEEHYFSDEEEYKETIPTKSGNKRTILVVDDHRELRNYLASALEDRYTVLTAYNAKRALELLASSSVSLVISDVMMPGMNGYELCTAIKSDRTLSHIPVVLLTAGGSLEKQVEGLDCGADDYMVKPFSMKYLLAKLENIFRNRELLFEEFSNKPMCVFKPMVSNKMEQRFVEEFTALVEKELSNPDLNMEFLAIKMNMSQSTLYKKLKGAMDLSPNDFIRICRLKRGATLLLDGELRINEIAFAVGFSSPSYFSTCFQKQFNMSPSEFIRQNVSPTDPSADKEEEYEA